MSTKIKIQLTTAQQRAFDGLQQGIEKGEVLVLRGGAGSGKTTILEQLQATAGGIVIGMRQFMGTLAEGQPSAIEEAFLKMVEAALAGHDLVLVDDLHLVTQVVNRWEHPRAFLLDAALTALLGEAGALGKKLVFAQDGDVPWPIRRRAYSWEIGDFTAEDYECICRGLLPAETSGRLDYARLHRFAPALSAQQLRNACNWLTREPQFDTERLLEYLQSQNMTSNVQIEEVERVDWSDLKGVDAVIRELEAKIALPFENDSLSSELQLKPKRGVLLAGPPGTGKTTIGRALAHRLKSKFFLIDGTMIAGSYDFYEKVGGVFKAASKNAPSVVFIDDADLLFEDDSSRGLYRYLLTMLDGLESASAGRVCVMLTAMNAGSLPQAMLRSGRVELWLETQLPDEDARKSILRARIAGLPAPLSSVELDPLASASHGLTGADLKNVVEDGKLLYAHDRARAIPIREVGEYFLQAIEAVRENRRSYTRSRPLKMGETVKIGFGAA